MSHLVSKILLSLLMFPLAAVVYIFAFVLTDEGPFRHLENTEFLFATGCTWLAVAFYWWLPWKSSIRWNGRRVLGTFVSVGAALLVGAVGGSIASALVRNGVGFGIFIGGILAITVWLIATVLLWRETAQERAQRIKNSNRSAITCPTCGYNLTGLRECRCPECGSTFTLYELMALQSDAGGID